MQLQKRIRKFIRSLRPLDRRKFLRVVPQNPLRCFLLYESASAQVRVECDIINISQGGIKLVTGDQKFFPKTPVQLEFQGASQNPPVILNARIVRTYRRHTEKWYYSGIQFSANQDDAIALVLKMSQAA